MNIKINYFENRTIGTDSQDILFSFSIEFGGD